MNDEQILHKLAEIEDVQKGHANYPALKNHFVKTVNDGEWLEGECIWNPLESWSDCGPLVEKYKPDITWVDWDEQQKTWVNALVHMSPRDVDIEHLDLKRAICLAIIESQADEKAA